MMTVKMLHCLMQKRKQLIDPKNPKSGMKIKFTSCVSVQYCSFLPVNCLQLMGFKQDGCDVLVNSISH